MAVIEIRNSILAYMSVTGEEQRKEVIELTKKVMNVLEGANLVVAMQTLAEVELCITSVSVVGSQEGIVAAS